MCEGKRTDMDHRIWRVHQQSLLLFQMLCVGRYHVSVCAPQRSSAGKCELVKCVFELRVIAWECRAHTHIRWNFLIRWTCLKTKQKFESFPPKTLANENTPFYDGMALLEQYKYCEDTFHLKVKSLKCLY